MTMTTSRKREPLAERIRRATRPVMIQVAPGLYSKHPDAKEAQEMTVACFIEDGPGTYRMVAHPERMVRVDQKILDLIGMSNQMMTMVRLSRENFIEMVKVAPRTYLLNLDSWYCHLRACAEKPDRWDPGSPDLKVYRRAIG